MTTNKRTKADGVTRATQLIAGVHKHLANQTQIRFAGGTFTPDQITTKLQSVVNLRADVDAAKAATKAKVAAERADTPSLRTFTGALVAFVKATFGDSPEVLADFGITLKARAPQTAQAKTAAAAKRAATRAARHTMGSKQKKSVKGAVTGITLTPVTAALPTATPPNSPNTSAPSAGATAPVASRIP